MLHQGLSVLVEVGGEGDLPLQDVPVDTHGVLVVEGVDSSVHLVDQHSQSPPIHGLSMPLVEDDLGSDVFGGPADGEGPALSQELGEPEISQFEVAVVADEQVFRLQISEDDVLAMEVFEAGSDDGAVETGLVSGEALHIAEVGKKFPAVDEFQDEVEVFGVLSESLEVDDEGVVDLGVDEVLVVDVVDLLGLHDLMLVEQLESHVLASLLVLGHLHLAEASLAEHPPDLIVI